MSDVRTFKLTTGEEFIALRLDDGSGDTVDFSHPRVLIQDNVGGYQLVKWSPTVADDSYFTVTADLVIYSLETTEQLAEGYLKAIGEKRIQLQEKKIVVPG